jgi:hypothetical protein
MSNDPMVQRYGADEGARIMGWARESEAVPLTLF